MRRRLMLLCGALVLIAGVVMLGATYLSMSRQLTGETRSAALNALVAQGGIALLVVTAATSVFGWVLAGRLPQPRHHTDSAARPDDRIVRADPRDEIKDLADTFDTMLERLDHALHGQRRFIANASHELRTPLTLNRALLEVAMSRDGASAEVRQLGETLLAINTRHERLIEGLLVLVRSERGITEHSYLDLADIVEHVVAVTPTAVSIKASAEEAPTQGNAVLLERLVQNLVDNAIRYNEPDGWVRVSSLVADGAATLVVSNTGPAVPRYEIPGLFEPFRRLDERLSSSGGAGLGLSIVRAVAHAHGGKVHADAREHGGLTVTVTLPLAS